MKTVIDWLLFYPDILTLIKSFTGRETPDLLVLKKLINNFSAL